MMQKYVNSMKQIRKGQEETNEMKKKQDRVLYIYMDSGVIKKEHKKIKTVIVDQALPLLCIYKKKKKRLY